MTQKPAVCIIIPAYNVQDYISKAIDSVLGQTLEDIELIVVDDCSQDKTVEHVERYEKRDSRVNLIRMETNSGQGAARNRGIEASKANYVAFLDADDWLAPAALQHMLNVAIDYEASIVECGMNSVFESDRAEYVKLHFADIQELTEELELYFYSRYLSKKNYISPSFCNKLFHATVFERQRFIEGCFYEDMELMPKVLSCANKVVQIPGQYYFYLQRETSTTRNFSIKNLLDMRHVFVERMLVRVIEKSQGDSDKIKAFLALLHTQLRGTFRLIEKVESEKDKSQALQFVLDTVRQLPVDSKLLVEVLGEQGVKSLLAVETFEQLKSQSSLIEIQKSKIESYHMQLDKHLEDNTRYVSELSELYSTISALRDNSWYKLGRMSNVQRVSFIFNRLFARLWR